MTDARPRNIVVPYKGGHRFLTIDDVDWFQARNHYVRVHCADTSHLIRGPLTVLAAELAPRGFSRISRSVVVNIDRVDRLIPAGHGDLDVLLTDGTQLRLSRTYRREFLRRYGMAG